MEELPDQGESLAEVCGDLRQEISILHRAGEY